MTDGDALLKAILTNPDEDTPRLMYADWLQENGDDARAELIRVQCALAVAWEEDRPRQWHGLFNREQEILRKHCFKLLGDPLRRVLAEEGWSRGFIESLRYCGESWDQHIMAIKQCHPLLREFVLDTYPRDLQSGRWKMIPGLQYVNESWPGIQFKIIRPEPPAAEAVFPITA